MKSIKRYCLTLDLKNDPVAIKAYEDHHNSVWPEVISSIKNSGILNMEIYRFANRLFMIIETNDHFSFEEKAKADLNNTVVQDWEKLMGKYQQSLPGAKPGEKWQLMEPIFLLP